MWKKRSPGKNTKEGYGGWVEDSSLGPLGDLCSWVMKLSWFSLFLESPDTVFLFGAWQKQNKTRTTNHNDNLRMIPVPKGESFSLCQTDNHSGTEPEMTIAS